MSSNLPPIDQNHTSEIQQEARKNSTTARNSEVITDQVSRQVHVIFEEQNSIALMTNTSRNSILEQVSWIQNQIKNQDEKSIFQSQCELIQYQISQKKFEKIPSELVVLLITHEWKKTTRVFSAEAPIAMSRLAQRVIEHLEKAFAQNLIRNTEIITQKKYTFNWLQYSIRHKGDEGILKLGSVENIQELHHDILWILRDNNDIQQIDFWPNAPLQTKRYLMDILSENRPLLGVLRIVPEGRVGTYLIRGVKQVNDLLSQQTADQLFSSIKKHLSTALNERFGAWQTVRITTSHNKLTIALPKESTTPLPTQEEINTLIRKAIDEKQEVLTNSMDYFQKTRRELDSVLAEIQVSCGESQVAEIGGNLAKLEAVYESEIRARGGVSGSASIARMKEIRNLEIEFANLFQNTRFRHGKYHYPATVLDVQGKQRPHPLLIEIIRKPGGIDLIEPERLGQKVKNYLDSLNRELDYIAPAIDFKIAFQEAHKIDMEFRKGTITRQALETTYKNSLSKTAFFGEIEGKTGACIMIDIKGMFIKNCQAYARLSDEISENGVDVPILKRLDVLGDITRAFIRGTEEINGNYPNILCTHGGDEFMFFIPFIGEEKIPEILKHARDSLGNEGFDVRASARIGLGSKEIFNALDGETKIAKIIEVIGRSPNGTTPPFLRHIEVTAESFSPDFIVSELNRRRRFVEFALSDIESQAESSVSIELRWLKIEIKKMSDDSVRINALPLETDSI